MSLGHHPLKRMLLTELERAEATIEPSVSHDVAREIAEGVTVRSPRWRGAA